MHWLQNFESFSEEELIPKLPLAFRAKGSRLWSGWTSFLFDSHSPSNMLSSTNISEDDDFQKYTRHSDEGVSIISLCASSSSKHSRVQFEHQGTSMQGESEFADDESSEPFLLSEPRSENPKGLPLTSNVVTKAFISALVIVSNLFLFIWGVYGTLQEGIHSLYFLLIVLSTLILLSVIFILVLSLCPKKPEILALDIDTLPRPDDKSKIGNVYEGSPGGFKPPVVNTEENISKELSTKTSSA